AGAEVERAGGRAVLDDRSGRGDRDEAEFLELAGRVGQGQVRGDRAGVQVHGRGQLAGPERQRGAGGGDVGAPVDRVRGLERGVGGGGRRAGHQGGGGHHRYADHAGAAAKPG